MERVPGIIRTSAYAVGVVVLAAGTLSSGARCLRLRATLERLQAGGGARITESEILDQRMYATEAWETEERGLTPQFTLMVVTGPDCQTCGHALTAWRKALSDDTTAVRFRLATIEASGDERRLIEQLRAEGRDATLLTIRDASRFSALTGVKLLPMAVVLDAERRVVLAASGAPSEAALRAFSRVTQAALEHWPPVFEHNAGTTSIGRSFSIAIDSEGRSR